jgi:hypothetical protein
VFGCSLKDAGIRCPSQANVSDTHQVKARHFPQQSADDMLGEAFVTEQTKHGWRPSWL